MIPVFVPCRTCHACCKKSLIPLIPERGDVVGGYQTKVLNGVHFLEHKLNGDCVYLGPDGCTVHDDKPFLCGIFDCRKQHAMYTKVQREQMIKSGRIPKEIFKQGATLIHLEKKLSRR